MRRIDKYKDMDCDKIAEEIWIFMFTFNIFKNAMGITQNKDDDIKVFADWLRQDVEE